MTPAQALASYRAAMNEVGEDIVIRRYAGTGPDRTYGEARVRGRVVGYQPKDLVGAIVQGDRRVILLNDPAAPVPDGMVSLQSLLPLRPLDRLLIRGREVAVKAIDDNTRRIAGVLIALEIQASG